MSDVLREVLELKREIVEARNQAIKTDNQVKNLGLDIKAFDRRFDMLEHRTRLFSITAHLLVAIVCGLSAYAMVRGAENNHANALHEAQESNRVQQEAATNREESLKRKLGKSEQVEQSHRIAIEIAQQIVDLLEKKQERSAADLLEKLVVQDLTVLEQRFLLKPLRDLRQKEGEGSLKVGRLAVVQGKYEQAISELQRVVMLDVDNQWSQIARPLLAQALYLTQRYAEAETQWRSLVQQTNDAAILEEATYYQSLCALRLGRMEEALPMLQKLERENGRFAPSAKAYLMAIERNSEFPQDLFGGKIKPTKGKIIVQSSSTNAPINVPPTPPSLPVKPTLSNLGENVPKTNGGPSSLPQQTTP